MPKQGPKGRRKASGIDHLAFANTIDSDTLIGDESSRQSGEAAASRAASLDEATKVRGDSIGRFLLIDVLGKGGMGTVLLGYDPTLNRRVAIKVLTSTNVDSAVGRLVREAQAMAKIQHPNVVTVFDAGEHDGQVFIAMELVEGGTFRDWINEQREAGGSRWREVLKIMLGAAEGLMAAHERDLVHRDFKPENILISEAGEVKVADFGLVTTKNIQTDPSAELAEPDTAVQNAFSSASPNRLTVAGALMGTPFYMAPEQFDGADVDAQADQFAFCVVLYEALYGQPPFVAESFLELALNVRNAKFKELPNEVAIPGWLRKIVLRGLAVNPADRFPSMKALVHELARDRTNRVARFVLVAALALAAGGAAWAMMGSDVKAAITCQDSQERLVGTWDPSVQKAIHEAFDKTGVGYAAAAWKTVHEQLNAHEAEWVSMRTETCEATRVHGTQSVELMDRRMACLELRRLEMSALTTRLAAADAATIEHAAEAVLKLEDLDHCSLAVVVRAGEGETIAPSLRAQVQSLQVALSQARAMVGLGQYAEGVAAANEVFVAAKEIEIFSLVAAAAEVMGEAAWRQGEPDKSVDWLISSIAHADRAGDQLRRLESLSWLIYVLGWELDRPDEALRWGEVAEVIVEKFAVEGYEKGRLQIGLGTAEARSRRFDSAKLRFQDALAIFQRVGDLLAAADALQALGTLAMLADDVDGALAFYEQSLEIRVQALGVTHPDTSQVLGNIASVYIAQEKYEEARAMLEKSLEISEAAFGEVHPDLADALNNLGAVDFAEGDYESAIRRFERAIAIVEATQGAEHGDLSILLLSTGSAYLLLDRPILATAALERSLSILRSHTPSAKDLADVKFPLARALVESQGARARARQLAEEALLVYESSPDLAEQAAEVSEWLAELR